MAKKKKKKESYNPIAYVKAANPGAYSSAYTDQLNSAMAQMNTARNNLVNFKYDPMQDAQYQALAQIYGSRGNQAAQDTLGDAASLNGGYGTSYAVSAAQQARNQYNQELAALVPDLEQNAYNRMQSNYGLMQDQYNLLMDADTQAYQRYRDAVADYQWGKGYDTDIYMQKKSSSGGGGGGRRRSGGGGGSYSGGGSGNSMPITQDDINSIKAGKNATSLGPSQGYKKNAALAIASVAKSAVNKSKKKK